MKRLIFFLAFFLSYQLFAQITPTNYASQANWAAGKMKGAFDMNFDPSFTIISPDTLTQNIVSINYDTTSGYDIFCLYPTVLLGPNSNAQTQPITPTHKIAANLSLLLNLQPYSQFGKIGRASCRERV